MIQNFVAKNRLIYYGNLLFLICFIIIINLAYYIHQYDSSIIIEPFPWYHQIIVFEYAHSMNGILLYIPFIYALIVLGWRGALISWVISIVLILPHVVHYSFGIASIFNNVLFLMVPLMVMLIITLQMRWIWHQKKILAEREAERLAYMAQVFKSQEEERQRIARELHDDTTQRLWILANRVESLISDEVNDLSLKIKSELGSIRETIFLISQDAKRLSLALRPSLLDDLGLVAAVRSLLDQLYVKDHITTQIVINGVEKKLSPEADIHIFRIIQESLNNVRRHADATRITVTLDFTPDKLSLKIEDNGKGFSIPSKMSEFTRAGKSGLVGIQQRVSLLKGSLNIKSETCKGTTMFIETPI